mmetsp:Transcript_139452/g.362588  ORF Transcript_139452/g.362588 Transcript_139452/m.362588 type:complete len:208 (-) Transcript_139452:241-864(-)
MQGRRRRRRPPDLPLPPRPAWGRQRGWGVVPRVPPVARRERHGHQQEAGRREVAGGLHEVVRPAEESVPPDVPVRRAEPRRTRGLVLAPGPARCQEVCRAQAGKQGSGLEALGVDVGVDALAPGHALKAGAADGLRHQGRRLLGPRSGGAKVADLRSGVQGLHAGFAQGHAEALLRARLNVCSPQYALRVPHALQRDQAVVDEEAGL